MSIRTVSMAAWVSLMFLSSAAWSSPLPDDPVATAVDAAAKHRDDENIEVIDDVNEYIARTRDVVLRARAGDYGRIKKVDMERVAKEQQSIEDLLGGRTGELTLTVDEQIQLANAQESINAIILSDDKSRMVCKRIAAIGTRLTKTECLSVAERERRAEKARDVIKTSNDYCVPIAPTGGEGGNLCGG